MRLRPDRPPSTTEAVTPRPMTNSTAATTPVRTLPPQPVPRTRAMASTTAPPATAYGAHAGSRFAVSWRADLIGAVSVVMRCLRGAACGPRACGPRSRRPSHELAPPVDDRPRSHVDHQGDREQHEAGRDERAPAGVAGLAEAV